jgi:hypothetical protein
MPAHRQDAEAPPADAPDDAPAQEDADDVATGDDDGETGDDDDDDDDDVVDEATPSDDAWNLAPTEAWGEIPADLESAFTPSQSSAPRLRDPGAWPRRVVVLQVVLVAIGSLPWWALLYLDSDWEAAELAWIFAVVVGAAAVVYGYMRRLHWLTAFGFISTAAVLLLQMRGAGLLLAYGVGTFTLALAGALAISALLGLLAAREIALVS